MPRSAVDGQPLRANMAAQADEVLDWTAVMRGAFSSSRQSSGHTGLGGGDHTPTTTVVGGGSALGRDVDAGSAPSEGDLDPVGNTPTGDDNISPIGGNEAIPRVSSPTSLTSFNASTTSPTARRTTPAETVSSGGTVVDAPSFGEGGGIGDIHHAIGEDNSTSHLLSSSSNRHESRDILGSARPTMDMPPFGQQNVLTNPDSLPAAGTANTTTMGSHSNVNVHAQPFQPFRTHSAGLGTTNVGSAFTPRPYPPSGGIPRVWSHFPAGSAGLGSPLFPARTLSGSTTISSGNQKHGATASTEGIAPALTSLNTNVSSQGPNAGPTSAVSTTSSLASPTPSSNWTQSPPLRAPMPAPQRQGSSVFGQISNLGAGGNNPNTASAVGSVNERTGISSAPSVSSVSSVSPTESVVRRPAFVHHSSYQSQTHSGGVGAGTGAGFSRNTSIGFGSSGGFGLATTTSPTLTRELNRESQSRSQTMQGHVQSPSMASALMSPPPPPTMPLHRQQQQQQQQRQDSIVQLQQSGLAHQHSFHGLPQQQQQQQMPQQPQHASPYGNPHVVAPNLPRRGYSDQFNFGPGQGIHGSHTGSIRDVGPEGGRGILQPSGGYQTHRQTLGGSIGSGVGMPHPYGPHSQNPNVMSNISLPPTSRPISPRHFSLLLNILREFRADGKLRPYRSKIGSELVQRDRMVYQRAGVGGFKEYVGQAEQMGYVRLGGHSGSPGKEWIELVVNE
ncbi:hypothetical protein FS842_011486 [Serendipita sp. 407]|nr:hypothetical protein FS842_011486 [Serendipita sp. 407]